MSKARLFDTRLQYNPITTARYIKSLGVQPDKLDSIFDKRKVNVLSFSAYKKATGT